MTSYTVINPATEQPVTEVDAHRRRADRRRDRAGRQGAGGLAARRARRPRPAAAPLRRSRSTPTSTSWPRWRRRARATRSGRPAWEAGQVRDVLLYYSAAPERLTGKQIPVAGGLDVTFHEPLGVVGLIVPWNFPMPILSWGMAPALAAGNTVVAKPAEMTPLTAIRIGELALEAGLPEGVFQVLPGKGSVVGQRLVDHPAVRKIVFTGSTEVGPADHGRLRPAHQAADPGTRRQEREHRLRRRRPREGRGDRAVRGVRQRRARTAAPGPGSWCRPACWTGSWSCSSPRSGASGSATRPPTAPRWAR